MKFFFLLLLSSFVVLGVHAQFSYVHGLNYRLDTFHFDHRYVLMQRYDQRDLSRVPERNIKERVLAADIGYLQAALDQMSRYSTEGQDVFYNVRAAEGHLQDIKLADPTFNCSFYEQELVFYKGISDMKHDAAEKVKQKEAREYAAFVQAQEAEKQRQKNEIDALDAAIEHYSDSLDMIELNKQVKKTQKEILKQFGPLNGKAINNGNVLLGMSRIMCALAWGRPEVVTKSTTAKGTTEKWIYTKLKYLVFTNGRVTAIHEGEVVDH